ncbi:MAG: hypothetical protein LOY04_06815 [Rhodococcus ruber]|nr:hypothetical protein [Rhodococcus ruber]
MIGPCDEPGQRGRGRDEQDGSEHADGGRGRRRQPRTAQSRRQPGPQDAQRTEPRTGQRPGCGGRRRGHQRPRRRQQHRDRRHQGADRRSRRGVEDAGTEQDRVVRHEGRGEQRTGRGKCSSRHTGRRRSPGAGNRGPVLAGEVGVGLGFQLPDRDGSEGPGEDRGEMTGEDDARAGTCRESRGGDGPEQLEAVRVEGVGEQRDVEQGRAECDEPRSSEKRGGPDGGEGAAPAGKTHRTGGNRERDDGSDEGRGARGGADRSRVGTDHGQERRDRHRGGSERGQDERSEKYGRAARHDPTLRRPSGTSRRDTP